MKLLDPAVRAQLRFVKVSDPDRVDMELFPDFLIIGPQRTGTTWLHRNLIKHPQLFMPEQKELYYFNTVRSAEHHPPELGEVSPELSWYLDFFKESPEQIAKKDAECRAACGEPYEPVVRGEATATYAAGMDREVIQDVLLLNPDMKVILMIRNPIDRAWSHAKKDLSKNVGRPLESVDDAQFEDFFGRWYQVQCGHYSNIIELWLPLLREGHLFIGQFDEIVSAPADLLRKMFDFFGVCADAKHVGELATKRINPTEPAPIPPRFKAILEERFADEIEKLAEHGMAWD